MDLPYLDVTYISSLSYFFLLMFGSSKIMSLILREVRSLFQENRNGIQCFQKFFHKILHDYLPFISLFHARITGGGGYERHVYEPDDGDDGRGCYRGCGKCSRQRIAVASQTAVTATAGCSYPVQDHGHGESVYGTSMCFFHLCIRKPISSRTWCVKI